MSIFNRIRQWWKERTRMYVLLRPQSSEVIISRRLYESIMSEHADDKFISVMFTKVKNEACGDRSFSNYAMFFNPDWERHGVSDPRSILTIPVTIGKLGHVGFQAVQPTAEEILTVYGIKHNDKEQWYTVYVSKEMLNGETYFKLLR